MRGRDDIWLILGGTAAVHAILLVAIDAGGQYAQRRVAPPAPHVELVEIEVPPPPLPEPEPPPPPVARESPPPVAPPPPIERPRVTARRDAPPPETTPPPTAPPTAPAQALAPGGAPVVAMEGVAPAARGVAVRAGPPVERIGRGGTGTGTGAGSGAGAGEAPRPLSVATIKRSAKPKGDYGFDAAKDYPAEAKAQGIEGKVLVRLLVDKTGKVVERKLLSRLGHGLDELALSRAASFEFEPAIDSDDRPVASVVVWTFTFTLPD